MKRNKKKVSNGFVYTGLSSIFPPIDLYQHWFSHIIFIKRKILKQSLEATYIASRRPNLQFNRYLSSVHSLLSVILFSCLCLFVRIRIFRAAIHNCTVHSAQSQFQRLRINENYFYVATVNKIDKAHLCAIVYVIRYIVIVEYV